MLRGLQRHRDPAASGQLAGPHAGAVDDRLALDVALGGAHPADPGPGGARVVDEDVGHRHALDDAHPTPAGALAECHRDVDRVGPPVLRHVEPREGVVQPCRREQLAHLAGGDLVHVDTQVPVELGHPAVLLEPVGGAGQLDETDLAQPGVLAGLGLEPGVQVSGVLAHPGRGLRHRPERDHQPGGVPGGAAGQPVALEQHDIGAALGCQVIGHRGADDAAADDDDPGPGREGIAD